ncbi:ROK family transcriptional regulator [Chelativorans sp. J32]|uniref:ROK family transcriptional regulator n=1 Tax=Chelativorans sp. J32 TaxID=935840 RepID=UPI00048169F7|nr:ROK family transcriptional regulator [Chelativorans sp. J32]
MNVFGTNVDHGQRFNRRLVLDIIRLHGPLSRAEIARRTGLAPQTISNIVDMLLDSGLVMAQGRRTGGRGQPPVDLVINPEGGFTVGVSFDHRDLVAVIVDLSGRIKGQMQAKLSSAPPEVVLPTIEATVRSLIFASRISSDRVWGVGVVTPSVFVNGTLVPLGPTVVSAWENFPLRQRLESRLELAVHVDNDATAAAVGEKLYGVGRSLSDFFYIFIGAGIGSGIIAGGRPMRGGHGNAGEIGHVVTTTGGRPCSCGNQGCLERYVALTSAQSAITGRPEGSEEVDVPLLLQALERGDPKLKAWLQEAASQLRTAIVTVENLLDPQAVVIGGSVPEPLLNALIELTMPLPRTLTSRHGEQQPRLIKAQSGFEAPALGAAALAAFENIAPDFSILFKRDQLTGTNA